jgi:hypothetical protein
MANMVADLKGSGASFPPGTTFGQVFDGKGGHWVASAGKKFINTAPVETTKPAGKPQRTAADVTAQDITTSAPHFSGRVRVLDTGEVQVQSRYRKDAMAGAGAGWQATITPMDPRNDVQRVFQGNDKKLEQSFSSSVEGPLAK